MAFNFNYTEKKEYTMYGNMVHESIDLYGLPVRYYKTDRVSIDHIFGEHKSIKVDKDVFDIKVKIDEAEGFTDFGDFFNKWGVQSQASINVFISRKTMDTIHPDLYETNGYDDIINNIIKLPSGKFMEVTHFEDELTGNNNLFAYSDDKKVFKLTLRAYTQNMDELDGLEEEVERLDLTAVFNDVQEDNDAIETEAVTEVQIVVTDEDNDGIPEFTETTKKPVVQKTTKKSPFGDL